jgi:hypothetical protein
MAVARTWIFTFDSLGGSHPAAIKNLQAYLRFEALDKKSVTDVNEVKHGKAMVNTTRVHKNVDDLIPSFRFQYKITSAIVECIWCILSKPT